jgi:hypothetical protein
MNMAALLRHQSRENPVLEAAMTTQLNALKTPPYSANASEARAEEPRKIPLDQHTLTGIHAIHHKLWQANPALAQKYPITDLFERHWCEGVTSESAAKINDWLRNIAADMIKGNLVVDLTQELSTWENGLGQRLDKLMLPHADSASLQATLSDINTVIPLLSSTPAPLSATGKSSLAEALQRIGKDVGLLELAADCATSEHLCHDTRQELRDALFVGVFGGANENGPTTQEGLKQLKHLAHEDKGLLSLVDYMERHTCREASRSTEYELALLHRQGDTGRHIEDSICGSIRTAKRQEKFLETIMPLEAVYELEKGTKNGHAASSGSMVNILRKIVKDSPRNDTWLADLFDYVSGSSANGAKPDFKEAMRTALADLSGCGKKDEETLAAALFKFALESNLPDAAKLLYAKAKRGNIDLSACLRGRIDAADGVTMDDVKAKIAGGTRFLSSLISKEEKKQLCSQVKKDIEAWLESNISGLEGGLKSAKKQYAAVLDHSRRTVRSPYKGDARMREVAEDHAKWRFNVEHGDQIATLDKTEKLLASLKEDVFGTLEDLAKSGQAEFSSSIDGRLAPLIKLGMAYDALNGWDDESSSTVSTSASSLASSTPASRPH